MKKRFVKKLTMSVLAGIIAFTGAFAGQTSALAATTEDPMMSGCMIDEAEASDIYVETEEGTLSIASYLSTDEVKAYGIDVSYYQKSIDWEAVADAGVTFAFIRVGYRAYASGSITHDTYAVKNIEGALAAGINVGVYFFSTAITEAEAEEEAAWVCDFISAYDITYPVAYDCEAYTNTAYRHYGLSNKQRTDNALAFLSYVEDEGYTGIFYNSKSHLAGNTYWDTGRIDAGYAVWVAQYYYKTYTSSTNYSYYSSYSSVLKNKGGTNYTGAYQFWQFSSQGKIDGITGNVDLDIEYYVEEDTDFATLSGQSKPATMTEGDAFTVAGTVSSSTNLTYVTVAVYDTSGSKVIGKTVSPGTTTYSLSNLDSSLKFGSLDPGVYEYVITATNRAGEAELYSKKFIVLSKSRTVSDGIYYIRSKKNTSYCLGLASTASGANAQLAAYVKDEAYQFCLTYDADGYYYITSVKSGLYLSVKSLSSATGANILQTEASQATRWQVLYDGASCYYFVPECATTCCMYLLDKTAVAGQNIELKTANTITSQRWKLTVVSTTASTETETDAEAAEEETAEEEEATAPPIANASTPSTMKAGSAFTITGKITSETKLTSVTAAVYDTNGKQVIGKTVKPGAKTYDLANVDNSIKFGSLSAGVYKYKVTATNSAGETTLVSKTFIVLSTSKTVSNGTYYITTEVNSKYCIKIKGNSKSSGANAQLVKQTSSKYKQFKITYKANGYYYIQDVGTGLYLSVENSASASGSNVIQTTKAKATVWQILPDGNGSYYFVPKCAKKRCLYLADGTAKGAQNVEIKTASISSAQRWTLVK